MTGCNRRRTGQAQALLQGKPGTGRSWQESCFLVLVIMTPLNPSGHLQKSEAAVRPRSKPRAKQARRPRKTAVVIDDDDEKIRPAVGTLSRTKTLLLAALKVWELKNGIRD